MSRIAQFFILTLASLAFATEFVPSSLPSQVAEVSTIVRGKIGSTYSDWAIRDEGGRGLFTFYQIQPTEVLKGSASMGSTILFREIGGEKDGVGETVPGAAQFTQGEDVVVMLGPQNKDGSYDLRGLSAGKLNITREEDGSESLSSVALSPPSHAAKWTIADLKKAVRDQSANPQPKISSLAQTNSETPKISPTPSISAAPQLQTSAAEPSGAKGRDSVLFNAMIALGLILIGFVIVMMTRKGGQSKK
jgi:hypothetical protein